MIWVILAVYVLSWAAHRVSWPAIRRAWFGSER